MFSLFKFFSIIIVVSFVFYIVKAANTMPCDNCRGKHKRVPVERPAYHARFCERCNTRHSAKEVSPLCVHKMFPCVIDLFLDFLLLLLFFVHLQVSI